MAASAVTGIGLGAVGARRAERIWLGIAIVTLALLAITAFAAAFDGRELRGESIWAKPMRFQIALAVHFATLALAMHALGDAARASHAMMSLAALSGICAIAEVAYIAIQAGRGEESHFNTATPLAAALYTAMAVGAVVIVAASAIVGAVVALDRGRRLPPALRLGLASGLIVGSILTLVVALTLGGKQGPVVGLEPDGGARLPLAGWSLAAGDLRVPHFLATHAMQAVPLAGLVGAWLLPRRVDVAAVAFFAAGWMALTLYQFALALDGRPFWDVF